MAFVYLIGDYGELNSYKIGMTRGKIEKRIKQLQTGNGSEIYLVDYYQTQYPFFIEKALHLHFFEKHKFNEWFELNEEDILDFKKTCSFYENNAKSLENNPFAKNILK
jgi:hypothetical protein